MLLCEIDMRIWITFVLNVFLAYANSPWETLGEWGHIQDAHYPAHGQIFHLGSLWIQTSYLWIFWPRSTVSVKIRISVKRDNKVLFYTSIFLLDPSLSLQYLFILPISIYSIVTPWSVSPVFLIVSNPSRFRPSSPLSPVYYILVFYVCLLPVRLVCQACQRLSCQLPFIPSLSFSRPPGFWPWPVPSLYPPAWPLCLPLTCALATSLDYWPLPAWTCLLPAPWTIKPLFIQRVCTWVSLIPDSIVGKG